MKDILLIEISTILGKIFKNVKQNDISINQVPSSLFLVKTILRLGKVIIRKLKDEYSISNLLNEQPKKIGEVLGSCI